VERVYYRRWLFCLGVVAVAATVLHADVDGRKLRIGRREIGPPYIYGDFDPAGFSDWIWYGPSDLHKASDYHEVLSGEWAAAVYYDGIDTVVMTDPNGGPERRQAMWLTRQFEYPYWWTNSRFHAGSECRSWDNPLNPTPGPDTGRSIITDKRIEIVIDYEMVDLEFLGSTSYPTRSPMGFIDPKTGLAAYMHSDRYCLLQTYTIRNIDPNGQPVTNLEFYQMLHSHGADEFGPAVNSTYTTISPEDPLQYYVPYNPVHQVGAFRYDITQWNTVDGVGSISRQHHSDYVGFSSTREPDWVDNDTYRGHAREGRVFKPTDGTHVHIEQRRLNGVTTIYNDEVAGAMGWHLGTLQPGQAASITVVFMCGQAQQAVTSSIGLRVTQDLPAGTAATLGRPVTYRICWEHQGTVAAENTVLVNHLPEGLTYPEGWWRVDLNGTIIQPDPQYDMRAHTYRWDLGTIPPGTTGCVELTAVVNDRAEPGLYMEGHAALTSTSVGPAQAAYFTPVECRGGSIIYVDARARGFNTGVSWKHAYSDLQSALHRAAAGCGTEIRVATGRYNLGPKAGDAFQIPDHVTVRGGYRGGRFSPDQRNPERYKTILAGADDPNGHSTAVLVMGDQTHLDGVTVTGGRAYGVFGRGVTFALSQCRILANDGIGVAAEGGHVSLRWCTIRDNGAEGIRLMEPGGSLNVANCRIGLNDGDGIQAAAATVTIENCIIAGNGRAPRKAYGVHLVTPTQPPIIRNSFIVHNGLEGVYHEPTPSPPTGTSTGDQQPPQVRSCVLWCNNDNGPQIGGEHVVTYSCVYDPNQLADPNQPPPTEPIQPDPNGNFCADPGFAYGYCTDPNAMLNLHLAADSPCIDRGRPDAPHDDREDIDREPRLLGPRVDIGADEVDPDCTDTAHPLDWNADGLVNLRELYRFAQAWQTVDPNHPLCNPQHPDYVADPNVPGYISPNDKTRFDPRCDLDGDRDVDLEDLCRFCEHWLWRACWKRNLPAGPPMSRLPVRHPPVRRPEYPAAYPQQPPARPTRYDTTPA